MVLSPKELVARVPLLSWFRGSLGKDHPTHNVHGLSLSVKEMSEGSMSSWDRWGHPLNPSYSFCHLITKHENRVFFI